MSANGSSGVAEGEKKHFYFTTAKAFNHLVVVVVLPLFTICLTLNTLCFYMFLESYRISFLCVVYLDFMKSICHYDAVISV